MVCRLQPRQVALPTRAQPDIRQARPEGLRPRARWLVAGWVVAHGWWLVAGTWLGVSKRLAGGSDEGIAACLRRREHRWLSRGEDGAAREAWCRRGLLRSGRKEGTGASTRRSRRLQALGVERGIRRHGQNAGAPWWRNLSFGELTRKKSSGN